MESDSDVVFFLDSSFGLLIIKDLFECDNSGSIFKFIEMFADDVVAVEVLHVGLLRPVDPGILDETEFERTLELLWLFILA